jgi:hypothetical protein
MSRLPLAELVLVACTKAKTCANTGMGVLMGAALANRVSPSSSWLMVILAVRVPALDETCAFAFSHEIIIID